MAKPPNDDDSNSDGYDNAPPRTPKRKSSTPNRPTPGRRKPQTQSPFQAATPLGPRTPAPRKLSAAKNTAPNSAPVRTKRGNEPSLLGDFLLGRPSPQRVRNGVGMKTVPVLTRRNSLDEVKAEMRAVNVGKLKEPGKVQDRVAMWQKTNANAKTEAARDLDDISMELEGSIEDDTEEVGKPMATYQGKRTTGKRPGKRKSTTPEDVERPGRRRKEGSADSSDREERVRSKSTAPRKRVISDSHWMSKAEKEKQNPALGGSPIPKDFLQNTAINPPVERKIEDWIKRTEGNTSKPELLKPKPRRRKQTQQEGTLEDSEGSSTNKPRGRGSADVAKHRKSARLEPYDDGIRVRGSRSPSQDDGIRVTPTRRMSNERETRVKPSRDRSGGDGSPANPTDKRRHDDIRVKPSNHSQTDDGIRITPLEDSIYTDQAHKQSDSIAADKSSADVAQTKTRSQRSKSHKRIKDLPKLESSHSSELTGEHEEEDKSLRMTPSPPENSSRHRRKSTTPTESLDEIPFGNSAFSVLDLPVGAEANTIRRQPPKRNPSFTVKVLKMVYNEGKKIVQDTVEPARAGPNQPPSIESWLKGTTEDPFIDRPRTAGAESVLDISETLSRRRSYLEDDRDEKELTAEHEGGGSARRKRRSRKSLEMDESKVHHPVGPSREQLPSMENSPPLSPTGLKRSPATRNSSIPKPVKKPLKESIFAAFKGESEMKGLKNSPSPYDGLREREMSRLQPDLKPVQNLDVVSEDLPSKRSSNVPMKQSFEPVPPPERERSLPMYPKRMAPTTGQHRLSTIASVETFNTSASASTISQTASEVSQTTVTKDTIPTMPTSSTLSRKNPNSTSNKSGLKRRLTKHSDLVSMLSLPDTTEPGRSTSIRSARSVRTTRTHIDTATLKTVMREVEEDETKYMRELNTLVDGVIPVLLKALLSKSDSAVAAGLLDPLACSSTDTSLTKHVEGMGIALEQMRHFHKRIPLVDPDAFLQWADSVHDIYHKYLSAWRTGFQDVVVNLAPASTSTISEEPDLEVMGRNKNGDVVRDSGERVDVAYLLKRPLARVKYLHKAIKAISELKASEGATKVKQSFSNLEAYGRRRVKEETARKEDTEANNTDATRARCPRTLAPIEDVTIKRSRQVQAKDCFSFEMSHSSGQRIECQVELIHRDTDVDENDSDILICEIDQSSRCLLFPPIDKGLISARRGDTATQLIVMIRGPEEADSWYELFTLEAEDNIAAMDWLHTLGSKPVPPPIVRNTLKMDPYLASVVSAPDADEKSIVGALKASTTDDVPLGARRMSTKTKNSDALAERERQRREAEKPTTQTGRSQSKPMTFIYRQFDEDQISRLSDLCVLNVSDLDKALVRARQLPLTSEKRREATRYQIVKVDKSECMMSGALEEYLEGSLQEEALVQDRSRRVQEMGKPSSPGLSEKTTTSLKENMRPDPATLENSKPSTPSRDDIPPPPPAHKTPVSPKSNTLKLEVLDSSTPKAKNRRTSSPLKHEYQPSEGSETSPTQEEFPSDYSDSDSSESDDELEALEVPDVIPPSVKVFSPTPGASVPNLASLISTSQGPYRSPAAQRSTNSSNIVALLSTWSVDKWKDIYPDPCSIVISPGLIEAFEINESHSSDINNDADGGNPRPLVSLVLTPVVTLRQSTALDIEIKSPHTEISRLKTTGLVRYRTLNDRDCQYLYMAIHRARLENPIYMQLEQDRILNAYGHHAYEAAVAPGRRRGFFGRKKSYRAAARAPASDNMNSESNKSAGSSSFFKRLSVGGAFNISKSSIHPASNPSSGPTSMYTSSSDYSGNTPPRSPSLAQSGSMYSNGLTVRDMGSKNLKIRLYYQDRGTGRWDDQGHSFLTIMPPKIGMRQASSLNHGIEKRIIVTRKPLEEGAGLTAGGVLLDTVLGSRCFQKMGRTGVTCNVWEDIIGDDGRVGVVGRFGGVAGTTRKWCFQTARAGDCEWIYGLVRSGE